MARHPTSFAPDFFLYDVNDVSEGRFRFQPDGQHQSLEDDAVPHPRLAPIEGGGSAAGGSVAHTFRSRRGGARRGR